MTAMPGMQTQPSGIARSNRDITDRRTNSMAKICMTHGWHDDNKGDSAILMGTIDFLEDEISGECLTQESYTFCVEGVVAMAVGSTDHVDGVTVADRQLLQVHDVGCTKGCDFNRLASADQISDPTAE